MRVALDSRYQSRKRIWKKFVITTPKLARLERMTGRAIYAKLYKLLLSKRRLSRTVCFAQKLVTLSQFAG